MKKAHRRASPPHRRLRNVQYCLECLANTSPPHRRLRKLAHYACILDDTSPPHRRLRKCLRVAACLNTTSPPHRRLRKLRVFAPQILSDINSPRYFPCRSFDRAAQIKKAHQTTNACEPNWNKKILLLWTIGVKKAT